MPRATPSSPLLPSSDPYSPYSKSEKTKKPFHSSHSPSSHSHLSKPILVFCIFSLLTGISGTIFALISLSSSSSSLSRSTPVFRCGHVQDSFRARYLPSTSTSSIKLPGHLISKKKKRKVNVSNIDRPKFLGFVGIQTGFDSYDRRSALRSTWFPSDPDSLLRLELATGLAFRFVIGRSKDAKKMAQLSQEIDKYKDFMIIDDIEEEYAKLPYKTLSFFKAAYQLFEADYYVKADDDIYMRPDRLATLLAKERTDPMTYIGCMKKGPVITDPKMKWYESQGHLIGNEYFLHAYGPMYILSAEVVASLATARNNSLRMFSNEDVTIGSWMLTMNVHHEDNRAICEPQCTPTSIAVWDIPKCSGLCNPAVRLKELHQIGLCSNSSTLPPDDEDDR